MDKKRFEQHLQEEQVNASEDQKAVLMLLSEVLELSPMNNPFEYVKELQINFDGSKIEYSDEYYDVLGVERKS